MGRTGVTKMKIDLVRNLTKYILLNFKKLKFLTGFILAAGAILSAVFLINFHINSESKPYILSNAESSPKVQAVLVLGAKVYSDGRMSPMLEDRAATALQFYRKGMAEKFLVSGDHGTKGYDEANAVKSYLVENGVDGDDIFLDYAGFDTYDSLYRAREIFKVQSAVIATQNFHLPRAVYIGRALGIQVWGISADRQSYMNVEYNQTRELLSKIKAFLDVNLHSKPKFLGEPIPITGDGRKSWD